MCVRVCVRAWRVDTNMGGACVRGDLDRSLWSRGMTHYAYDDIDVWVWGMDTRVSTYALCVCVCVSILEHREF